MLSHVVQFLFVSALLITIECHSDHDDEEHDHDHHLHGDLTLDLANIFKLYGNDTRSMRPEHLREFLGDFVSLQAFTHASESRYECLQNKVFNFNNLTLSWRNDSVINRSQFAKMSAYLLSYVNKCYGAKFNITESYDHIISPPSLSGWQKFKKNVPLISKEKWLYSFVSVIVISIVGLLCVVFIPILNACCFDYLFQFLVALALGTLAGDAFLHLIPHAFMPPHGHGKELSFLEDFSLDKHNESHTDGVYKGLGCLVGMYIFFIIEKVVQMKQVTKEEASIKKLNKLMKNEYDDAEAIEMVEQKPTKKAHGHSHGGVDKAEALKSNAWMVILGDALHNFSDGLAIGASFSTGLTTGFGTSIAVFFHELPHEIGDFAVLRRAGVSMKTAVIFNVVSSVFCFLGVIVGILIGGIEKLNSWSFLFIAGTFIYISLVDIIPELNEVETAHDTKILNFFIQNCGILMGVGIMFLIAIYEDAIHQWLE